MRNLLITAVMLLGLIIATEGYGVGWMEFGAARFMENGKVGPVLSVGLHEPLLLGVAYESWNGVGVNVRDNLWMTSKHDLVFGVLDKVDFGLGVSLRHNDVNSSDVHANVKVQLWD